MVVLWMPVSMAAIDGMVQPAVDSASVKTTASLAKAVRFGAKGKVGR